MDRIVGKVEFSFGNIMSMHECEGNQSGAFGFDRTSSLFLTMNMRTIDFLLNDLSVIVFKRFPKQSR